MSRPHGRIEPVTVVDPVLPGKDPSNPVPVSGLSQMMNDYIARLGTMWVEGQVAELNPRARLSFLSLRDTDGQATINLYTPESSMLDVTPVIEQGSRVIAQIKPDWWKNKGSLQFKILQIRVVGLGELMARLEALRNLLAAEGLFSEEHKKPIPFLPRRVGLICGSNSKAGPDVVENARRRWPDVEFEIREVQVQGATAVREVTNALTELDAIDDIDVIVVARGGGSFEDLLPFSDESLVRAIAAAQTPIVVAIGHEDDRPLVDYVADYRASTPTDAARKIVPDVAEELAYLETTRAHAFATVSRVIALRGQELANVRAKPALANPSVLIDQRLLANTGLREQIYRQVESRINLATAQIQGVQSTLRALSPQGTLDRGYAIVRNEHGAVVKSKDAIKTGEMLSIKIAQGAITVQVTDSE